MPIQLLRCRPEHEGEVISAIREFSLANPEFTFAHGYRDGVPFAEYVTELEKMEQGEVPEGWTPATFLFAWSGTRVVGRVSFRHRLTPHLERVGGHIGYAVLSSERRKGFATEILRQSLSLARAQGLSRVLLTCDFDNEGSIRTIERNGGVLENTVTDPSVPKPKRRYWIDLSSLG